MIFYYYYDYHHCGWLNSMIINVINISDDIDYYHVLVIINSIITPVLGTGRDPLGLRRTNHFLVAHSSHPVHLHRYTTTNYNYKYSMNSLLTLCTNEDDGANIIHKYDNYSLIYIFPHPIRNLYKVCVKE